ncbi:MAG: hypothetical protein AAF517_14955 [Planctomycetota bacterium]
MKIRTLALSFLVGSASFADEWTPTRDSGRETPINGRQMEVYRHGVHPSWGYETPQEDFFVVLRPTQPRKKAPLYVVLHSAGHDVFSCVNCTKTVGNHDIYRSPDDHFALYVDCRKNKRDWWWGGMHLRDKKLTARNSGGDLRPVEKRVIHTVKWAIERYGIDSNRVYLSGNSMGGSGTLGIGMRHGDVFAAIKANVPAGVEHVSNRMYFSPASVPQSVKLPEPPICINYSAQNDGWSTGHERFVKAMNDRKYALYFYWGPFGHANNSARIKEVNDLIDSFDWLEVKRNEAYAVFTDTSTNSTLPWPSDRRSKSSGQVNAFLRWKVLRDEKKGLEVSLFSTSKESLKTRFEIPTETRASVTLRRLQKFRVEPAQSFRWSYGEASGIGQVGPDGFITVPRLSIDSKPTTLRIEPARKTTSARFEVKGKGWRIDRAKIEDETRPRVLLIGDSILSGYRRRVIQSLEGQAYVDTWVNPHWQSAGTNRLVARLIETNGPYEVVHFNMGLHGWPEGRIKKGTFESLTKAYVDVLKSKLPKARLIWASSTPVTTKGDKSNLDPDIDPIIVEHNRMAAKVMKAAKVPVSDLYSLLVDRRELAKGDRFHWTGPAYRLLADRVTETVRASLTKASK